VAEFRRGVAHYLAHQQSERGIPHEEPRKAGKEAHPAEAIIRTGFPGAHPVSRASERRARLGGMREDAARRGGDLDGSVEGAREGGGRGA